MPNGDKNMKRTPRFTNSTALNIQISDHLFIGQANHLNHISLTHLT